MLNHIFMHAPNAMLLIDPVNNKFYQANESAVALFNLEHSTLLSTTVTQHFHECLDKLVVFTQQLMLEGEAWSNELSLKVKGQIIPVEIEGVVIEDKILMSCQKSEVIFKRHQQAISQSNYKAGLAHWDKSETIFEEIERQNKLLLTALGDGIYGVDSEGNTTFVNLAAEKILGWKKSELIGKNIHDVIHHSHSDGTHYHVHQCPIFAAFNDGAVHSVDNEVFWTKSGQAIPVEYTSTPLTDNGLLIGAVVVFRDITERKQIQSKLLNALDEVDALKRRLEMENAYLLEELNADFNHHQIIGKSAKVNHMVHQIELVGPTDANVLIIGESGTGKELIARAIHEVSERKSRPLIRVNCAAIPAELFESEFFGHVKGAFSGAISDRVGRFELADGATIFLDEVGEIPLQLQGKLLRVLQEQQFERVGESTTRSVDVRVISATNQDLKNLIEQNKFREDLFYRLNVIPIHSPSLRDRIDDIPLLVKHFIDKVSTRFNQPQPSISVAQMQILLDYHWPGNIRELENIIERQIILASNDKINFDFLAQKNHTSNVKEKHLVTPNLISAEQHKLMEKQNLVNAIKHCKGKIYGDDGAAYLLGLKPTTLSSKLKKYQIERKNFQTEH